VIEANDAKVQKMVKLFASIFRILYLVTFRLSHSFLPRCMECRRCLAMRILSVCQSIKRVIFDKMEERSVQIFSIIQKII